MELKGKNILVIGGSGLLGSALCRKLDSLGLTYYAPRSKDYNIINTYQANKLFTDNKHFDICINCFVSFGGILKNAERPGSIFFDNLQGNINIINAAKNNKVEKFIQVSSQCIYGDTAPLPFKEDQLHWHGLPTENNAPYGFSKRAIHVMLDAYRKEFNFDSITLIPSNMYGPGDNFHPEHTHVIPALIRRFVEAKENNEKLVSVWGDSSPTREFLFNEDCAEALILAAGKGKDTVIDPANIGTGVETSIYELATLISRLTDYEGFVTFGDSALNGQKRRVNDISRQKKLLNFEPKTNLEEGLKKTIQYFLKNRNNLRETKIY